MICPLNDLMSYQDKQAPLFDGIWSCNIFIEGVINSEVYQG
jgi:hypothetical protein